MLSNSETDTGDGVSPYKAVLNSYEATLRFFFSRSFIDACARMDRCDKKVLNRLETLYSEAVSAKGSTTYKKEVILHTLNLFRRFKEGALRIKVTLSRTMFYEWHYVAIR